MKKLTEKQRIDIVNEYLLIDSEIEIEYDNITFLASKICNTPISTITLVDETRQWFKSKVGFNHNESPKSTSFCALAISKNEEVLVIPNLMADAEFSAIGKLNGLEKDGFYASVIIYNEEKVPLGTLCVIDYESKTLNKDQVIALKILGGQVEKLFKMRLKNIILKNNYETLLKKYDELKQFSSTISHDIQSPVNNIISLTSILQDRSIEASATENYLDLLVTSSYQLKNYITNLLQYSISESVEVKKEEFLLYDIIKEIEFLVNSKKEAHFEYNFEKDAVITTDKMALTQIILNIVSNGMKYNTSKNPLITINFYNENNFLKLSITDNGIGIKKEDFDTIFQHNITLAKQDREGNYGTGLGLSIVKKLAEKNNLKITIESEIDKGSTFILEENK